MTPEIIAILGVGVALLGTGLAFGLTVLQILLKRFELAEQRSERRFELAEQR